MHLHTGVLALKLGDQLGHQGMAAGVGNADAQAALLAVGNVVEFLLHAPVALLKIQRILQKHLPGIGQFQGHVAHKQGTAQFLFNGGNVGAERLLGDVQALGRFGEAFFTGNHDEVIHAGKVHKTSCGVGCAG